MLSNPRLIPLVLLGLLAVQAGLLGYSARVHSPAWDEVGHLAAGISHWEFGKFELYSVNPPLIRTIAAAPVVAFGDYEIDWSHYRSDPKTRSEVLVGRRFVEINGQRSMKYFFWARLAILPVALFGTCFCFLWGRDLFGPLSGLLAAGLWALSPTVLAYGSVITPDLGSAVAVLSASYVFWRWLREPSWAICLIVAMAVAIAMLTKSVWLLLLPLLVPIWVCKLLVDRRRPIAPNPDVLTLVTWPRQGLQMLLICSLSLLLTNGFYGFTGSFQRLDSYQFCSESLAGSPECEDCPGGVGNRFEGKLAGMLLVPLPANYLNGIDVQRRDFERAQAEPAWKSYLFGEWKHGGWWYYYIVGLLVKVPLPIWLLFGAGTVASFLWQHVDGKRGANAIWGTVVLWAPALALFVLVSINTGLNRYVRYAIPILPVVFIWGAQSCRLVTKDRRWVGVAIAGLYGWLAISTLSHGPHWLSYFNPIAGGSRNGHTVLCDSNIDWGQDLLLLQDWLEENRKPSEALHCAYFGVFDPAVLGIEFKLPPPQYRDVYQRPAADQSWMGPQPGLYVVSKNYLVGHPMPLPDGRGNVWFKRYDEPVFSYFNDFEPIDSIGYSMLVYRLSSEQVDAVRKKTGLSPLDSMTKHAVSNVRPKSSTPRMPRA